VIAAPGGAFAYPATGRGSVSAMRLFIAGLLVAVAVFAVSGGHVLFLPLLIFLPLGGLALGRAGRRG
jgi:hypothetical protein